MLGRTIDTIATTNQAADKAYAYLYREFRERLRMPREVAEWIYESTAYVQRFYSDDEIEGFIRKWSA